MISLKYGLILVKYSSTDSRLTLPHRAFLKNKKRSGISLNTSFSAWFLRRNICLVILFYFFYSNFIVWLPLLREILDNMCIVFIC